MNKRPKTAFDKWSDAGRPKKRKAKITASDKYGIWVEDEFGQRIYFVKGSMHYPGTLPVGTKGVVEYQTSASYGLYFFVADKKVKK